VLGQPEPGKRGADHGGRYGADGTSRPDRHRIPGPCRRSRRCRRHHPRHQRPALRWRCSSSPRPAGSCRSPAALVAVDGHGEHACRPIRLLPGARRALWHGERVKDQRRGVSPSEGIHRSGCSVTAQRLAAADCAADMTAESASTSPRSRWRNCHRCAEPGRKTSCTASGRQPLLPTRSTPEDTGAMSARRPGSGRGARERMTT